MKTAMSCVAAGHDSHRGAFRFTGIEPGAVWEDVKIGMQHRREWERIAMVTDVEWIRNTMRAFGFLVPCEVRMFPVAEMADARSWIVAR